MKLRKKLVLSALALAACATTMVSTTFAWYTSNTNVSAGNINGTTAESGSDLLLISQDAATNKNWSTAIDDVNETATPLVPMQYNVGASVNAQSTLGTMGSVNGSDGTGFVSFDLYLKNASTKAGNLGLEIVSLTNQDAGSLPAKPVIGTNHKYIGIANTNSTYFVDMLRVLCMEIEVYTNTQDSPATWTLRTDNVYEMETHASEAISDSLTGSAASTTAITDATGKFSAHQYYNTVMGLTDVDGTSTPGDTRDDPIAITDSTVFAEWNNGAVLNLGTLPTAGTADTNNTYLKVTFKLFLNGWDLACFDACQGQTFDLGLRFSAIAA